MLTDSLADLIKAYGDPRGPNGRVDPHWAGYNLVPWMPPYPLFYSDGNHTPLKRLSIHKKCVATFDAAFADVLNTLGAEYIAKHRLNICGGTYNYRLERGGSKLSVHSWGIAIDMDPGHNPFPSHWKPDGVYIDKKFVDILVKHGFCWRGAGKDIDPMHFQLAEHT